MKKKILEKIKAYDSIIIHRHVRPDPDALGSQGGLAEILKASFPEKQVFVVGEEEPSLQFLNKMDVVLDKTYQNALVIVCDTANQARISDERYTKGDCLIKIDHHPNMDVYGDLIWVDEDASSVSEMIYEFYLYGKEESNLQLPPTAARLLYAGIVGDTGRFLYSNTRKITLQYAGELLETGIKPEEIYNNLYKTSLKTARLNGYVLQHFTYLEEGVGYIFLSGKILEEFNATPAEASILVNSFSDVEGLKAWVFFIEEPEKEQIRVRLRSKGPIVNTLAAKYNGGGHPRASGATIYTKEEMDSVVKDLIELCK
jgi:bifunctional oligoribonuclease and PAP phosphatase NrnA